MKFKEFRKKNVGLLLILPWWIGFAIFKLYPFYIIIDLQFP